MLETVPGPGETIKFVDQIVAAAPESVRYFFWSWGRALFGRYDVIHFHWPEYLLRDTSRARQCVRRILFRLLLLRLRHKGVARTVHNTHPHARGDSGEGRLLRALDRRTDLHVTLNECTPRTWSGMTRVIPHAHYRDQFSVLQREDKVPGRLLFIGRIEPYKRVPEFLRAAMDCGEIVSEVRVVGKATPQLEQELLSFGSDQRETQPLLHFDLRVVSDAEMVQEITAAEIVVLPYAEMLNSGVALVALSLNTPIIVPVSCVNTHMSAEVGAGWIAQFDGVLDGPTLAERIWSLRRAQRSEEPCLSGRDWQSVARAYATAFHDLMLERRSGKS